MNVLLIVSIISPDSQSRVEFAAILHNFLTISKGISDDDQHMVVGVETGLESI